MNDEELRRATTAIPALLAERGPLSVPEVAEALQGQGIGEEAARLGVWALIDRSDIELLDDWRVGPLREALW